MGRFIMARDQNGEPDRNKPYWVRDLIGCVNEAEQLPTVLNYLIEHPFQLFGFWYMPPTGNINDQHVMGIWSDGAHIIPFDQDGYHHILPAMDKSFAQFVQPSKEFKRWAVFNYSHYLLPPKCGCFFSHNDFSSIYSGVPPTSTFLH